MARTRADAEKYDEELESVHIKIPASLKQDIRMTAAANKMSMAVLLRDALEQGWEKVSATEKKSPAKKS